MSDLCRAVTDAITTHGPSEGVVLGLKRQRDAAARVVDGYGRLTDEQKIAFLLFLADDLPTARRPLPLLTFLQHTDSADSITPSTPVGDVFVTHADLRRRMTSRHERFLLLSGSIRRGVPFALRLRADARRVLTSPDVLATLEEHEAAQLREMEGNLQFLFSTQLTVRVRQITPDSSSALLAFLRRHDRVRPVRSVRDLRCRLGGVSAPSCRACCPSGVTRLCFGLFHPTMPTQPLVYTFVAVMPTVARRVREILPDPGAQASCKCSAWNRLLSRNDTSRRPALPSPPPPPPPRSSSSHAHPSPSTATFYSINNTNAGLQGLQLASLLLFLAVERLLDPASPVPCADFVTLSPVPKFRAWLTDRLLARDPTLVRPGGLEAARLASAVGCDPASPDVLPRLCDRLTAPGSRWWTDAPFVEAIQETMVKWCARYILFEKRRGGKRVLDQVANFHGQNGACLDNVSFLADTEDLAMTQSWGLMVNYRYSLDSIGEVSSVYRRDAVLIASRAALLFQTVGTPPVFRGVSPAFLSSLDNNLYAKAFNTGDWIMEHSNPATHGTYIINVGTAEFVAESEADADAVPKHPLTQGDAFSPAEGLLFTGLPAFSVRATSTPCYVFLLPAPAFHKIAADHPQHVKAMIDAVQAQLANSHDAAAHNNMSKL